MWTSPWIYTGWHLYASTSDLHVMLYLQIWIAGLLKSYTWTSILPWLFILLWFTRTFSQHVPCIYWKCFAFIQLSLLHVYYISSINRYRHCGTMCLLSLAVDMTFVLCMKYWYSTDYFTIYSPVRGWEHELFFIRSSCSSQSDFITNCGSVEQKLHIALL